MTDRTLSTGDSLRTARRSRNLSQRAVGELVGKSQQWCAGVEAGRITLSLVDAVTIARALGVKVDKLTDWPREVAS